jgi:SAM-dependent methyltransferase
MNNYEFCAKWAEGRGRRVLDYGCGAGEIVGLLRKRGVEAFGCDVFYEGGSSEKSIPDSLRPFICRMDERIPFADQTFDVVVSNMVLEHVPDLDSVLREMRRVLRPGGVALNVFPHREVWREGHCGVPLLHRIPRGRFRLGYALSMRSVGFGYFTDGKTAVQWSREFCDWLDRWTHYRPKREIHELFARHFASTEHIEHEWLKARLGRDVVWLPTWIQQTIVRKLAGIALVSLTTS